MSELHPTKRCSKCKQEKATTEFYRDKRASDGLYSKCKDCHNKVCTHYNKSPEGRAIAKRIRKATRLKRMEGVRKWRRTEKGRQWNRDYRIKTLAKVRARMAVGNAVTRGEIPPATARACTDCGGPAVQYHHHLGYEPEHWLDVTPLCRPCHKKADTKQS